MVSLVRKYLLHDRTRFVITISATSLAILLIFTLTGIYLGFYHQATAYIDSSGADLWVLQKGAPNFYFAISFLPSDLNASIAKANGVQTVSPLIAVGATITKDGRNESIFFFGYDTRNGLGGPSSIIRGSAIGGENQLVVDSTLAKLGFDVGDTVSVNGHILHVVGVTGMVGVLAPVAFSSLNDARKIIGYGNFVNYFLVKVSPGTSIEGVSSFLRTTLQGTSVFSNSKWAASSRDAILAGTAPIIQAMTFMGGLTGILIVGLTNYTATVERQREYGILKALGIKNRRLFIVVLEQSIIVALSAFVLAAGLSSFQ